MTRNHNSANCFKRRMHNTRRAQYCNSPYWMLYWFTNPRLIFAAKKLCLQYRDFQGFLLTIKEQWGNHLNLCMMCTKWPFDRNCEYPKNVNYHRVLFLDTCNCNMLFWSRSIFQKLKIHISLSFKNWSWFKKKMLGWKELSWFNLECICKMKLKEL
jgi:hypothetical protein